MTDTQRRFVVVGIGADGWAGLGTRAQNTLRDAAVIYGSARQLALLPQELGAQARAWTSPMSAHLTQVLDGDAGTGEVIHLLASGDPMFHGLGATVVHTVGAERVTVLPAPSSISLAAAKLGWDLSATAQPRVDVASLVTGEPDAVIPLLTDGARVLVLSRDGTSPAQIAELLCAGGFGESTLTVLGDLGGPDESTVTARAADWDLARTADLNITAIACVGPARSRAPGLPDEEFAHDGQLTKQTVRAVTVAALAPAEGQLLWDVGAGSGSIGIEWLRQTRTGRVVCFEADPARTERILANARAHGVADRLVPAGAIPAALADAPAPDRIFVGGGLDVQVLDRCWAAIAGGGRLVANAVTLQTEQLLVAAHADYGGTLTRLAIERAGVLGTMTAWRPALPVVQWVVDR
ncbi:precorrin-6Y C5,15-methyltransferase [Gordonia hirsuta DSM 44140 = NBRC 16056]|uniref:Precorrin-6Y C5,15-methyltransferase n=1 Tax=Gordonia hirsuta DSM 44140 = NBRC 16056 TaxID=1121927 RepID=L7L7T8_9ACTN|nr:bifunctional cobalt-precorrin-7 (C(5))-methyltransferase/cobalt-precorrin-6B (C(15))-methyltransferase [Gordonia hirsuta]GAC56112.1 precorrin-6Y C5,15-methyltransferase [Gordonia hirsuta DSM 44140 = NBRC 16056]